MKEFESLEELEKFLSNSAIEEIAVQGLDLKQLEGLILKKEFKNCVFLGCQMSEKLRQHLYSKNYIFPVLDVPFQVYPKALYSKDSLYDNYDPNDPESYKDTYDKKVYDHYISTGKQNPNIKESLARRLHDHSITDSLHDFLEAFEEKKVVAIMGGHSLPRTDINYKKSVLIARELAKAGYLVISGGGPGAMEATHVGAWFAKRTKSELETALKILSKAPEYNHPDWLPTAFEVIKKFPKSDVSSLGIPTWLYGHEPPTPFATHIAKYFANSVREEGLLAIAKGGIIFAPGSAGTMQEIFQDIAQNHYESFGYASPMVFLDVAYWSYKRPVFPMIQLMHLREDLKNLKITLFDEADEIIKEIKAFK